MTLSGDPLRRAFDSTLRRDFGNLLRRVFNDPLRRPPQETPSGDPLRRPLQKTPSGEHLVSPSGDPLRRIIIDSGGLSVILSGEPQIIQKNCLP